MLYTGLRAELESLVESYPHLSRIYSVGKSVQDRELLVIQISEGVTEVNISFGDQTSLDSAMTSSGSDSINLIKSTAEMYLNAQYSCQIWIPEILSMQKMVLS